MDPDYRLILDTLGEGVIVADRSGRITYANPAAEELLGWPSGGLRGLPVTAVIPPHLRSRHAAGFNRYRSSWQPRILGRAVRLAARRRNGVEVPVELTLTTFRGRGGQELYLAALHDLARRQEPDRAEMSPDGLTSLLESLRLLAPGSVSTEAALARAVEQSLEYHFQAALAQLWVSGEERGTLRPAGIGRREESDPPEIALEVVRKRAVVCRDGAGAPLPVAAPSPGEMIAGLAAFPLMCGETLAGVLVYGGRSLLTAEALRSLELLSRIVAGALGEVIRRGVEADRELARRQIDALSRVAECGAGGAGRAELLEKILALALELTGLDEALLVERAPNDLEAVLAAAGSKYPGPGETLPPGSTVASRSLQTGELQEAEDYRELTNALPLLRQRGVRACVAAPVRVRGKVVAALQIASRKAARSINPDDRQSFLLMVTQAAAVLARE